MLLSWAQPHRVDPGNLALLQMQGVVVSMNYACELIGTFLTAIGLMVPSREGHELQVHQATSSNRPDA